VTAATNTGVALLREIADRTPYTDLELERLIEHVGSVDLVADALMMRPKPSWLHLVATGRQTR
jgi:hypothetical protein